MGVPYVVEAYPRQVLQPVSQKDELMSDAAWLQGFTIGAAANKRLAGLPDAQPSSIQPRRIPVVRGVAALYACLTRSVRLRLVLQAVRLSIFSQRLSTCFHRAG